MSAATAEKIGKLLILMGIINLVFLFASQAFSAEVQIIEIRKSLPLKNSEPVITDYYLNAGENLGIKPGTLFTLYRRVSVLDRLGGNQGKPLAIPVGKIKILYVSQEMSVARVHTIQSFEKSPILEFQSIMMGDVINVGSAELSKDQGEKTSDNEGKNSPERIIAEEPTEIIELKAKTTTSATEEVHTDVNPENQQQAELVR